MVSLGPLVCEGDNSVIEPRASPGYFAGTNRMVMHESLVTVATFFNQTEFLLARARLESANIECFTQDENMLRIAGWHSQILGGIKLQVRQSDAPDAMTILRDTAPINL